MFLRRTCVSVAKALAGSIMISTGSPMYFCPRARSSRTRFHDPGQGASMGM